MSGQDGAGQDALQPWLFGARLPSLAGAPLPSVPGVAPAAAQDGSVPARAIPSWWMVPALCFDAATAARWLLTVPAAPAEGTLELGATLRFWIDATHVACELLRRWRMVPTLERQPAATAREAHLRPGHRAPEPSRYLAHWRLVHDTPEDAARLEALTWAMPPAAAALCWVPPGGIDPSGNPDGTLAPPVVVLHDYLHAVADATARRAASRSLLQAAMSVARGAQTAATPGCRAWLQALFGDPELRGDPADLEAFYAAFQAWRTAGHEGTPRQEGHALAAGGTAGAALAPPERADPDTPEAAVVGSFRVCFRLEPPTAPAPAPSAAVAPAAPDAPEAPQAAPRDWVLRYLLQATDDPSLIVPASIVWHERGETLHLLNRALEDPQEHLLAALAQAARLFPPIGESLQEARPQGCRLSSAEAQTFIGEVALSLQAMGFGVLVPAIERGLSLRAALRPSSDAQQASPHSRFGILRRETLVRYDWQVALGGELISRDEFEALAALKQPLVQVRGRWVELQPQAVDQALAFFSHQAERGELSLLDALKLALAPAEQLASIGGEGVAAQLALEVEVAPGGWLEAFMQRLSQADQPAAFAIDEPPGFVGQLRGYQKTGVAWLDALRRHGLGACLADDMGLGKTVMVIALLLHERASRVRPGDRTAAPDGAEPGEAKADETQADETQADEAPTLLICPTSVVGNWRRELARFAPSLRVLVHHGAGRQRDLFAAAAQRHDVVISTYALLHRDQAALRSVTWDGVILDEAQNIKNASTQTARAARQLPARWRAALTGTPVENRVGDL
ncbi:MAG TPA: DEAD/DEAH box helicase, partial [Chloroflexota bacterium]|nr:DEAD/DEAH box helicase [Chloroflexota bacterium]